MVTDNNDRAMTAGDAMAMCDLQHPSDAHPCHTQMRSAIVITATSLTWKSRKVNNEHSPGTGGAVVGALAATVVI